MKVLSLFSGIGAFEKALDNMGVAYDLAGFSEIDKYATKSYCAIHGVDEEKNYGDITKIDETALPSNIDLITYGFPCQDISLAGNQKGLFNEDGTKTRSGLFFDALRVIESVKPKVAIAENVKNLTSKKFEEQFKIVLDSLEFVGYNNYWAVLNAKDYGIPQNRERVFIVSIRKDIDNGTFTFPEGFPLELRLKDMLEDEVDAKYYLEGKYENITRVNENYSIINGGVIGKMHDISRRAYSENAVSPTIPTCAGGNIQPKVMFDAAKNEKILVKEATKKGYAEAVEGDSSNFEQPNSKTRRGRVGHGVAQTLTTSTQQGVVVETKPICLNSKGGRGGIEGLQPSLQDRVYDSNAICTAITPTFMPSFTVETATIEPRIVREIPLEREGWHEYAKEVLSVEGVCRTLSTQSNNLATKIKEPTSLRIRKLTPKECWRLMGFDDSDFEKAEKVNSNTQLYKQAGNSIVVPVLEYILEAVFSCGALENILTGGRKI